MKSLTNEQEEGIKQLSEKGITVTVVSDDTIVAKQTTIVNGDLYNQKELVDDAKRFFGEFKIKPSVYSLDTATITIGWIEEKIKKHGIKPKDLEKQLALKSDYLEGIFAPQESKKHRVLTPPMKALFFYYFMVHENNSKRNVINVDLEPDLTISEEREKAIKVMLARESMKDFNYTIEQVCELYGLKKEDFRL